MSNLVKSVGLDPQARSKCGVTPLHMAAKAGNTGAIQFLVSDCKVDVEAPDAFGRRALHFAALHGHYAAIQALVKLFSADGH